MNYVRLEILEMRTQATPVVKSAPIARKADRAREFVTSNIRIGLKEDFLYALIPSIGCYHPHLNIRLSRDEGKLAPVGLHYVGMGKY